MSISISPVELTPQCGHGQMAPNFVCPQLRHNAIVIATPSRQVAAGLFSSTAAERDHKSYNQPRQGRKDISPRREPWVVVTRRLFPMPSSAPEGRK